MKNIIFKNEIFSILYNNFNALDLWRVGATNAHPAINMNLKFIKIKNSIPGFGIYAVSYNDFNYGERIIYLGKFAGEKKGYGNKLIDDATRGDVRDRWFKHIGTATLLLANLKMSSKKKFLEHKINAYKFYSNDNNILDLLNNSLLGLQEDILNKQVFLAGKDLQISGNRLGFALQNINWTNKRLANTTEELSNVVSRFNCHYWQVVPNTPTKKSEINKSLQGTKDNKGAESLIIKKYCQKLPMNDEYKKNIELLEYYHYDPSKLIKVSNEKDSEFSEFSNFINIQLQNMFKNN
jgi:hypothetical protein